jgi:hypothetical protein
VIDVTDVFDRNSKGEIWLSFDAFENQMDDTLNTLSANIDPNLEKYMADLLDDMDDELDAYRDQLNDVIGIQQSDNSPNLIINEVKFLSDEIIINEPVKLEIKLENIGDFNAISTYDKVGLWLDVNGNDSGWESLSVNENNLFLKAGEEKIFNLTYEFPSYVVKDLEIKDGENKFEFYIDGSCGTYDMNHPTCRNGYILESNEQDNSFSILENVSF